MSGFEDDLPTLGKQAKPAELASIAGKPIVQGQVQLSRYRNIARVLISYGGGRPRASDFEEPASALEEGVERCPQRSKWSVQMNNDSFLWVPRRNLLTGIGAAAISGVVASVVGRAAP
jgi:hypothetical protein